jgi:hypothetical protein
MASTGKGALARRKKRRLSQKRARKAAAKAKYEQWIKEGRNTKSKRVKLRAARLRKTSIRLARHVSGPCGNVGCKRCNPAPWNLRTPNQLSVH